MSSVFGALCSDAKVFPRECASRVPIAVPSQRKGQRDRTQRNSARNPQIEIRAFARLPDSQSVVGFRADRRLS